MKRQKLTEIGVWVVIILLSNCFVFNWNESVNDEQSVIIDDVYLN